MPVEKKYTSKLLLFISQHLNWFIVAVILIWLLLGYLVLLRPRLQAANRLSQESNAVLSQELADKQSQLDKLNELIDAYNKLNKAAVNKVEEFLPADRDLPGLFMHAEALAKVNDSALLSIQVYDVSESEQEKSRQGKIPSDVGVVGADLDFTIPNSSLDSYFVYKNFLAKIENNLRLLDIEHINFNPFLTTLGLTTRTYYLKVNE